MKNLTFADISERKISEFVKDESSGSKIESYDGGDSWGGDFDDLDDVLCQVQYNPTLVCGYYTVVSETSMTLVVNFGREFVQL